MVQVLPDVSFGAELARGLGGGFSKGVGTALSMVNASIKSRAKRLGSLKDSSLSDVDKYAKQFAPAIYNDLPKKQALHKAYLEAIEENPHASKADLLLYANKKLEQEQGEGFGQEEGPLNLGLYETRARPEELAVGLGKMGESLLPRGAVLPGDYFDKLEKMSPSERFAASIFGPPRPEQKGWLKSPLELAKKLRPEGLSPEQEEQRERESEAIAVIAPLLAGSKPGSLLKSFGEIGWRPPTGGTAATAEALAGGEAAAAREAAVLPEAAEAAAQRPKITEAPPEDATALRLERTRAPQRLSPIGKQAALREKQLAGYETFREEIAQDAAERAARAEKRAPKTAVGRLSEEARMKAGEKQFHQISDDVAKISGQLRSIEKRLPAALGPEKASLQESYEILKNQLDEAIRTQKDAWHNWKFGEARYTPAQMRERAENNARTWMGEILEGKEPSIKKRDFNQDMIEKGRIAKAKPKVPGMRESDFYSQVHDEYKNVYQGWLDRLKAQKPTHGSPEYKGMKLFEKLVAQSDAENAIQARRWALREMDSAKRTDNKLRAAQQTFEGGKTQKVAVEEMRNMAREALASPEKAEEIAQTIAQRAAQEVRDPKVAEKIAKEGPKTVGDALKETEELAAEIAKGPSLKDEPRIWFKKARLEWDALKKAFQDPAQSIWKTKAAQDFMGGVLSELLDPLRKKVKEVTGKNFPIGSAISVGYGVYRRSLFTIVGNQVTAMIAHQYRVANYKDAIRKGDNRKVRELDQEYSSGVRKQAIAEYNAR